jgi:hypothetical protein
LPDYLYWVLAEDASRRLFCEDKEFLANEGTPPAMRPLREDDRFRLRSEDSLRRLKSRLRSDCQVLRAPRFGSRSQHCFIEANEAYLNGREAGKAVVRKKYRWFVDSTAMHDLDWPRVRLETSGGQMREVALS